MYLYTYICIREQGSTETAWLLAKHLHYTISKRRASGLLDHGAKRETGNVKLSSSSRL